jgi:DNA-binding NarL/FixJ family response regulator
MRGNGDRTAVVLDRHPLWLDALERLLAGVGVSVIGKTTSPDEALELLDRCKPGIYVAEYEAFEESDRGLASLEAATATHPGVRSVVLSSHDDSTHVNSAFAAGAAVYCVKTAEPEDLASAIRQACQSSIYFAAASRPAAPPKDELRSVKERSGLTPREIEILKLVAEGYSNSQLAKMLWVTEQTVKFHLSNIYRKLEVANRTEASRWAQLHGLLPDVRDAATAAA